VKGQLSDISHLTEEDVDALAFKYLEDVKAGRQAEWTVKFFPQYNEAKMFLHAYGRVLAKSLSSRPEGQKIYVNSCTPGFTATDINLNHHLARSLEEGADTPVWISLYPRGGPTGGLFRDRADFQF
jgi:carbonyl reductase 1